MSKTYVHEMVHSGAETLNDQLAGTAVAFAGPTGIVRAAYAGSDGTSTATLKGRESGLEIIPSGSHALQRTLADYGDTLARGFIYMGRVKPNEALDLQVVAATASTSAVAVSID